MISKWSSHKKNEKEQKEFESLVRNSTQVLGRMNDLIQEKIDTLNKEKIDDGFENPNWALKQANLLGQIKACLELQKLTKFTKGP